MAVWPNGSRTRPDFSSTWQSYKGHNGLDMKNFDINHAVMGGTVVTARWSILGGGWIVEILADDGHLHRYLHNLKGLLVKRGQRVETGQRLAYQGSTGKSTGKHLHFAVRKGGRWGNYIDPLPYLQALVGSAPAASDTTPFQTFPEGDSMPAVIERTEGTPEWSLVLPSLAGPSELERGYIVTSDPKRALWWERFYELGSGTADKFGRDEYIAAQKFARLDHEAWVAGQPDATTIDYTKLASLIKLPTAVQIAKTVNDDAAKRLQS